jgi:signal transduction histidine kinase
MDTSLEALVDRLATHRTISPVPRAEQEWLASHGYLRWLERNEYLVHKGDEVDKQGMFVILAGKIAVFVDRGAGPRKVLDSCDGDVTGLMPFSRMSRAIGEVIAVEPCEVLVIEPSDFPAMIRECPEVTAICVHAMLDRARAITSSALHDEKLVSLGKLSAGLAHELNNPASALVRSAGVLALSQHEADSAAADLVIAGLTGAQLALVGRVRDMCLADAGAMSPLERADREESLAGWLDSHGADTSTAAALAETPLTIDRLDELAAALPANALSPALRWVGSRCTARRLTSEIETAASRIYELVAAVKGFTQMDRATAPEPTAIAPGLRDTVAVLGTKAREKQITVRIDVEPDLPAVLSAGGDLNQVWARLIDNALDAAPAGGTVTLSAVREHRSVVVRVIDEGPGIPEEIRSRVFDPFFTTKPVGQGAGLGLDIARRVLRMIDGQIEFECRPGRTEFRVTLPAVAG